jgi:hypothetical protein
LGGFKSEPHDAGDTGTGEDGDFGGDLFGQAAMGATALAGVLAFGVLADDDPVEIGGGDVAERGFNAGQDAGGADVGVLVEGLADGEAKAPEGDVVGNIGRADGSEEDGTEWLELRKAVRRHHDAMLFVVVGAPGEVSEVEGKVSGLGGAHFEDFDTR